MQTIQAYSNLLVGPGQIDIDEICDRLRDLLKQWYDEQLEAGMGQRILWDLPDDEQGNVQHINEHDLTTEEVDDVLVDPDWIELSRSTGLPIAFGTTRSGRMIAVVFRQIDIDTIRPVTAFEI